MRRPHLWRKRAAAAIITLAVAACVVLFLPAGLGGAATYMTTHGTSMEPKFHTGDLAIVKPVNTYRVGDVAVYHSRTLHTLVMHRIIRHQGSHYVFKGDHNSWTDPDRPTRADLVGKLWWQVPHGGTVLDQAHRYWMMILPAALLLFLGTSGFAIRRGRRRRRASAAPASGSAPTTTPRRRRSRRAKAQKRRTQPDTRKQKSRGRRRRRRSRKRESPSRSRPRARRGKPGRKHAAPRHSGRSTRAARRGSKRMRQLGAVQLVAGGALVAFLLLGGFAWSQPPTQAISTPIPYKNQGAFAYSATVPDGPVYGTRGVQTGDPIYLRVVNQFDVGFAYHLLTDAPHTASGTVQLDVDVSDTTGWHETVPLVAATRFVHGVAEVHATLDLARIQALIAAESNATGVRQSVSSVKVVATVHVSGRVADHAFTSRFSPGLAFQLDSLVLKPSVGATGESGSGAVKGMRPATRESVTSTHREAATVGAFGVGIDVTLARWIALGGTIVAAIMSLVVVLVLRPLRRNEVALIDARAGHMIVPVAASTPGTNRVATIDVTSMADLVRLAERYDRLILHQCRDGAHVYLFEADGIAYRYSIRDLAPALSDRGAPAPVG